MKTFLTLALFIEVFWTYGQTTLDRQVGHISKEFEKINSSNLSQKTFRYSDRCGVTMATITVFSDNDIVRKITDVGIGDDDKAAASWSYQYYYENGKLIFSYEKSSGHDLETGTAYKDEVREYFVSDRLIMKIKNGQKTYPKSETINTIDTRYRLMNIKNSSDIKEIYKCLN